MNEVAIAMPDHHLHFQKALHGQRLQFQLGELV